MPFYIPCESLQPAIARANSKTFISTGFPNMNSAKELPAPHAIDAKAPANSTSRRPESIGRRSGPGFRLPERSWVQGPCGPGHPARSLAGGNREISGWCEPWPLCRSCCLQCLAKVGQTVQSDKPCGAWQVL